MYKVTIYTENHPFGFSTKLFTKKGKAQEYVDKMNKQGVVKDRYYNENEKITNIKIEEMR